MRALRAWRASGDVHLAHLLHRQRATGREVLRRPARRLEKRLREALALLDERLADERDEQEEDGRRDAGHAHLDGGIGGEREDADGGASDDEDAASTVVENGLVSECPRIARAREAGVSCPSSTHGANADLVRQIAAAPFTSGFSGFDHMVMVDTRVAGTRRAAGVAAVKPIF